MVTSRFSLRPLLGLVRTHPARITLVIGAAWLAWIFLQAAPLATSPSVTSEAIDAQQLRIRTGQYQTIVNRLEQLRQAPAPASFSRPVYAPADNP